MQPQTRAARRLRGAAVAAAVLAGSGVAAGAPDFDLAADEDRARLVAVESRAAAGDERAVFDLDALFGRVARPVPLRDARSSVGDALVEVADDKNPSGTRFRSVRALVRDAARRLPDALRQKLVDAQRDAAETERKRGSEDDDALRPRGPPGPAGRAQAARLAARAFEAGDDLASASLDRHAAWIARVRGEEPRETLPALFRRAATLARAGEVEPAETVLARLEAFPHGPAGAAPLVAMARALLDEARRRRDGEWRQAPEGKVPDLLASFPFARSDQPSVAGQRTPQSPVAARKGDLVFASDGSRVLVVDARAGELRGRLPQPDDAVAPPASGWAGTVSIRGDVVLAPLFFESFLLPGRGPISDPRRAREADEGDPAIRGGFFSLFAFDARALRLLWWDGDAGTSGRATDETPRGRPAGAEAVDERTWRSVQRGHVVGRPLQDGRRVYVPVATATTESQVWVHAWERRTGEAQPLVLVPAWQTYLALTPQAQGAQGGSTMPLANPRLAIDPEGRVVVWTDLGVLAAIDARTGNLEWVTRFGDDDLAHAPGRTRGRAGASYLTSNDPPVVVPGDGVRPSIAVVPCREEERFVGVSCEDGGVVWRSAPWTAAETGAFARDGEAPRVARLASDVVLGYGGRGFVALDGRTGASLLESSPAGIGRLKESERPVGPVAPAGRGLCLLPLGGQGPGRARRVRFLIRRDEAGAPRAVVLGLLDELTLLGTEGPFGVQCLGDRLVVTSTQRVLVYSWIRPGDQ